MIAIWLPLTKKFKDEIIANDRERQASLLYLVRWIIINETTNLLSYLCRRILRGSHLDPSVFSSHFKHPACHHFETQIQTLAALREWEVKRSSIGVCVLSFSCWPKETKRRQKSPNNTNIARANVILKNSKHLTTGKILEYILNRAKD